jgi:hypothetical protein
MIRKQDWELREEHDNVLSPKDWTGNTTTIKRLGASNHTDFDRAKHDYYATDPKALELLLELESFKNVWEPCCGEGHLSEVLKKHGIHSKSTDLIDRGYGEIEDFLFGTKVWSGDIITNPPYKYSEEIIKMAIESGANKIGMFLPLQFLESKGRKIFFKQYPPKNIYISSSRLRCAMNGNFDDMKSNAIAYTWFIWEKDYKGETILKWFN